MKLRQGDTVKPFGNFTVLRASPNYGIEFRHESGVIFTLTVGNAEKIFGLIERPFQIGDIVSNKNITQGLSYKIEAIRDEDWIVSYYVGGKVYASLIGKVFQPLYERVPE